MTDKTGGPESPHPHAKLMALYAEDAAETDRPWDRWEGLHSGHCEWHPLHHHPRWVAEIEYRRKPRVRSLNGFEYPEPEREAPAAGEEYWSPVGTSSPPARRHVWSGCPVDQRLLRRGMVHLTLEAAEAHARAIILAGGGEV